MNNNDERDYAEEQYNRKFTAEENMAEAEADKAGLNSAGLNSYMKTNGAGLGMHYSSDWRTSEYSWLATEPLYAQLLDPHAALVWDETHTAACILDTDDTTGILTVNNTIINWNEYHPALLALLADIRDIGCAEPLLYPPIAADEVNPMLAPGQHENNVVNKLDCGHELDTEEQRPIGELQFCSMHGYVRVVQS
jgi:hypothetical protein